MCHKILNKKEKCYLKNLKEKGKKGREKVERKEKESGRVRVKDARKETVHVQSCTCEPF